MGRIPASGTTIPRTTNLTTRMWPTSSRPTRNWTRRQPTSSRPARNRTTRRWPTSSRRTQGRPTPSRRSQSRPTPSRPTRSRPTATWRMASLRATTLGATRRPGRGWLRRQAGSYAHLTGMVWARLTGTAGATCCRLRRVRCPGRARSRIAPGHRPPGPRRLRRGTQPGVAAGTARGRRARGAYRAPGCRPNRWSARPGRCGVRRAAPGSSRGVRARGRGGRRLSPPPGRNRRACGVTRVSRGSSARRKARRHRALRHRALRHRRPTRASS